MSLRPARIGQAPSFGATAKSPAQCLTQTLPPENDARVLLLGSGDVRHILFTAYSDSGSASRQLDFTCCDLASEVIARNVLILSLILDADTTPITQLWEISHHVFIDASAMCRIQAKAQELLQYTGSLENWKKSALSKIVRFCDGTTLEHVAALWNFYALDETSTASYEKLQSDLKAQWNTSKLPITKQYGSTTRNAQGLKSALPYYHDGLEDIPKQHGTFSHTGTLYEGAKNLSDTNVANPLFYCDQVHLNSIYAFSPATGLHLATSYATLTPDSPLLADSGDGPKVSISLQAVLKQFSSWCEAFRKAADRVVIRYVEADPLAACHVLQHQRVFHATRSANWYRNTQTYCPLILDSAEYAEGGTAPDVFNVIDTCDLAHELGPMSILAACSPLLDRDSISTLRTQMFLPVNMDIAESTDMLFSGDLASNALLLGLQPLHYWANATSTWDPNSRFLHEELQMPAFQDELSYSIMLWKPVITSNIRYSDEELSGHLFKLFLSMFCGESASVQSRMSLEKANVVRSKVSESAWYNRASYVTILKNIKTSGCCANFDFMIMKLISLTKTKSKLAAAAHYLHDFILHIDEFSVATPGPFAHSWHPQLCLQPFPSQLSAWTDIPAVLCVAMVVHRKTKGLFDNFATDQATPQCELTIHVPGTDEEINLSSVQLGFGTVQSSGRALTDQFRVNVQEDPQGWKGTSPLVVSGLVTSRILLRANIWAADVIFRLKLTPQNVKEYYGRLGNIKLPIFESALGKGDVYVSRYRPGMHGHMSVGACSTSVLIEDNEDAVKIKPRFNAVDGKITSLEVLWEVKDANTNKLLEDGAQVTITLTNPFTLIFSIANTINKTMDLPLPLDQDAAKPQVARRSHWLRFTAPVAKGETLASRADIMFPLQLRSPSVLYLEGLHYVNPQVLPKLLITKDGRNQALNGHLSRSAMWTLTEYIASEAIRSNRIVHDTGHLTMSNFIQTILADLFSPQITINTRVFHLHIALSEALGFLIIDSVRLDVSNQTILIDAAFLPVHGQREPGKVATLFQHAKGKLFDMSLRSEAGAFLKHLLPASAERCREWQHKEICEYNINGRVPLTTDPQKQFMCSCGTGIFPPKYLADTPDYRHMLDHAIHVAIPTIFPCPFNPLSNNDGKDDEVPDPAVQALRKELEELDPLHKRLDAMAGKCWSCGSQECITRVEMRQCSGCGTAQYCSRKCQKKDWEAHKKACKAAKKLKERGGAGN